MNMAHNYGNNSSRHSSFSQGSNDRDRSYSIHGHRREGGRGGGGNRGGNSRPYNSRPNYSNLPLEQGVICSLKESFGFIYCADRPEEVFFHYSESEQPLEELALDTEVEFRIGMSQRNEKLNAYQVRKLEPGTIVWQTEDEPGKVYRGLVERPSRTDNRMQTMDGIIRMLVEKRDGDQVLDAPEGPELLFRHNDYQPALIPTSSQADSYNVQTNDQVLRSNPDRRGPPRLLKGDLVEFSVVTERRCNERYARNIKLILSEKERLRQEQEHKLLAEATEEVGVVTALKGEYGFLRSNKRREEIYFHYSTIDMEESEHALGEGDLVLKEGQDMKFLVVDESDPGDATQGRRRLSARRVSLKPKGSVKFHDAVACGVTGVVILCPQPADAGHSLEAKGKVLLHQPIETRDSDGNVRLITEVYLSAKDSPGGTYYFRGGSSAATWIQLGDTILFDVVSDFVDGACHAAPTKHGVVNPSPFELEEEGDSEHPIDRRIRLLSLSLMARSEGVIHTVKEAYGFIHFSERPVDVHFKLYQVLPDELQNDLRTHMGLLNVDSRGRPLRLEAGVEVMFDISVHGRIHSASAGRHHKNQVHDRENLKAQRILFLPPGTVQQSKVLGRNLRGRVSKKDHTQIYAGTVELDTEVMQMSLEERHPLVAQMVGDFLASPVQDALVFHDILSAKEDDVVMQMIESKAKGLLAVTHIPEPGETVYPGKLSIRKLSVEEQGAIETNSNSGSGDEVAANTIEPPTTVGSNAAIGTTEVKAKKRRAKACKKLISVRFDKSSLSEELKRDAPLAVSDIVEFDVVQSRRTGMAMVENMRIIERLVPVIAHDLDTTGYKGIVKEVVSARNFGFIAVMDETASKRESLFFQLSSVAGGSAGNGKNPPVRKGDEVAFDIVVEKNGKRIAKNVRTLPKGTIPGRASENACRGLILVEPTQVQMNGKQAPMRHMSSVYSTASDKSSRWGSMDEEPKENQPSPENHLGCILLLEDPSNMFSRNSDIGSDPSQPPEEQSPGEEASHNRIHLFYNFGGVAIHGVGATDESSAPRRGDLVSFEKANSGIDRVRDIRIVSRGSATVLRGRLENIRVDDTGKDGTGTFIATNAEESTFEVKLAEVMGCDLAALKEKESVEGLLHDGQVFGVCQASNLHLESKFNANNKERPKLNLTVKKDRGGKIMAQSHMAKGPDGTLGFASGWTSRMSIYGTPETKEEGIMDSTLPPPTEDVVP